REKKSLGTINAIQESLHAEHPSTGAQIMPAEAGFSHSLGRKASSDPKQTYAVWKEMGDSS
ncbi:hypothetical protein, partial [Stenotrophomonas maltophilia]|uniref:hypothetical protein n=1 Tax=Stenotrophomonas maltophilia TaxID=40324 RepID=UPI0039DF3F91